MGWLDALLGRSSPVAPDLDALFALPSAAVTLEAATGLQPTGTGAVCVKPAEGPAFARAHEEALALLRLDDAAHVDELRDSFGFLWSTVRTAPDRLADVVTALHGANTSYGSAGFGPSLLCSGVGFAGDVEGRPRTVGLVYLYKRGTFYPFAPVGPQQRDTALELQLRGTLAADLPVETELQRWFAVWDAPFLSPEG
ncbi:MAG TPA: hypothetical protein VM433_14955 [Mycobacteriales bacterium]|nr:hypothetical protein [Mycobacteriales bacterium]